MVLLIDDFTTGVASLAVPAPTNNQPIVMTESQDGSMLGGTRLTTVFNALSPAGSPARLDVANGRLKLRMDRNQYGRLELTYGVGADGGSAGLGINLQAGSADRIRITIAHLDLPLVNLNVVIHTANGWSSIGQNVGVGQVDFRFADFTGPADQDFTNVRLIGIVFQASGGLTLGTIETDVRGSLLGDARKGVWLTPFGTFTPVGPEAIEARRGEREPFHGRYHAEAHHTRVLGADFVYSARITANWSVETLSADLQFRISDEGRYGVRLKGGRISFYRLMLPHRVCNDASAGSIGPCPSWPPKNGNSHVDLPVECELGDGVFDTALPTVGVTVVADGSRFVVAFDRGPLQVARIEVTDTNLGVGRFGLYVIHPQPVFESFPIRFDDLTATTDPTALSNFALLHSVPGYDANGTKQALVRTLNDMDAQEYDEARSSFTIRRATGDTAIDARPFTSVGPFGPGITLPRTLGFQFLAADFTDLREPGTYTIEAQVATTRGVRALRSAPFEVRPDFISATLLRPMSILNAEMRRAADEEFRRNWRIESGQAAWSVGVDGAFVADRADDQAGAVIRRIHFMSHHPLEVDDFRLVAQVTIVAGCDAQLQFRITAEDRWGVTLQAGSAAGCRHGDGPPAVRLHREGPAVANPAHFEPVASEPLDAPFMLGTPYDVEVRARGPRIRIVVNGQSKIDVTIDKPVRRGSFALKAWGSSARFDHVKMWGRNVKLSHAGAGVWIPYSLDRFVSSQGFPIRRFDTDTEPGPENRDEINRPFAAQQHGFNDCNGVMGESTSHGMFLSALMDAWATRAHAMTSQDQERLRRAIQTGVLYFTELLNEGDGRNAYAHQEPGRAALAEQAPWRLDTMYALLGLSSFVERGAAVDRALVRATLERMEPAWHMLHTGNHVDLFADSIVAIRVARALQREGQPVGEWLERAHRAATAVLEIFGRPGAMANSRDRFSLRTVSLFEGVYEVFASGPFELTATQRGQLAVIVQELLALANNPANAFCIMPQADDVRPNPDPTLAARNWHNLADLPLAFKPFPPNDPPVGDLYSTLYIATAAADCVHIGRLAGERALERLATGSIYWGLGLNPGVPKTKLASLNPSVGPPWGAASFVYNGPGRFTRTNEGNRMRETATKSVLQSWESCPDERGPDCQAVVQPNCSGSRHRESWSFDPLNNGYATMTNGFVLRENQWHYWSVGIDGWVGGETFMLTDAVFLRAALALEDWHNDRTIVRSPYDVSREHFFDTTHIDRAGTGWGFDDAGGTIAAQASRMATDFATGKGFGAGRPTGHHAGEHVGVLCLPTVGTIFVDVTDDEIAATAFPFADINTAHWAQVARAAAAIATARGLGAGFFTGHQLPGKRGWIGIDSRFVTIFDIDEDVVNASPWAFTDINAVHWAQAMRLATDVCLSRGFTGGFFTGHQLPNRRQIAALRFM